MDFFTADLHLGGETPIRFDGAPFKTPAEMAEAIVRNWNTVVGENDRVFVLGDAADVRDDDTAALLRILRGHKILVMGNHDGRGDRAAEEWFRAAGFERVYDHPIVAKRFFVLSHEPIFMNSSMPFYNIFGHVHGHPAIVTQGPQTFCACACRHGFAPVRCAAWEDYRAEDCVDLLGF